MANSVDPDLLASLDKKPTVPDLQFAKAGYIRVQQDKG